MHAPWFLARFYQVPGGFGLVLDNFEGYLRYKMIASQNVSYDYDSSVSFFGKGF